MSAGGHKWFPSSSPRWAGFFGIAVLQIALGGLNAVDGGVLLKLFADPSGRSVAPSQQYLLDSPLLLALGHWLGIRSYLGLAVLSLLFVALPFVALLAAYKARAISEFQVDALLTCSCIAPLWRILGQYLGKPDGLTLVAAAALVLSEHLGVSLLASSLLVANHLQQGSVICATLIFLAWPNRSRVLRLLAGWASGLAVAALLALALGIGPHSGRIDYLREYLAGSSAVSVGWLLVAIVGSLSLGWIALGSSLKHADRTVRWRVALACAGTIALGCVAVDNSRDIFLLTFPILLHVNKQSANAFSRRSLRQIAGAAILAGLTPDVAAGAPRLTSWIAFWSKATASLR